MDSLTHIALGACIGEVALGKKLGKKALAWGALAASLPDIDAVAGLFLSLPDELIAHRGVTHSFLFAASVPLLLAWICHTLYRKRAVGLPYYYGFFVLQIVLHDLLDSCNAYGTGLLEPFSQERFSFNLVYVADPLFSIWPVIAAAVILFYRKNHVYQKRWAASALLICIIYLGISVSNKFVARSHLDYSMASKNIKPTGYFLTPTPFNNMLWYAVAATDSGYYVGHLSVFDDKKKTIPFNFFLRNEQELDSVENQEEVISLKKFAGDYYTVERWNDTLVFNVLRFGQMIGWQEPKAHFAFHYFLNPTFDNDLVVQRGRFEGWNKETLTYMYNRIKGSVEDEKPRVLHK
jgi:inner membrane protein